MLAERLSKALDEMCSGIILLRVIKQKGYRLVSVVWEG